MKQLGFQRIKTYLNPFIFVKPPLLPTEKVFVAHAFHLSTLGARAGGTLSSRPAWSTWWILGQSGVQKYYLKINKQGSTQEVNAGESEIKDCVQLYKPARAKSQKRRREKQQMLPTKLTWCLKPSVLLPQPPVQGALLFLEMDIDQK